MLYHAQGSSTTELSDADLKAALIAVFDQLGPRAKVIALPPDFTRANSHAGPLTCMAHEFFGERLTDVMPALGTHFAMPDWQLERMFPTCRKRRCSRPQLAEDVVTIGEVPADFVREVTEGIWDKPWPAQTQPPHVGRRARSDSFSIGQVVPHEVIGMANYNKNIFVGTGGQEGINESHFIGAAYGMERMMGRADNPLRRILNKAEEHFCQNLPVVYVLTVIGPRDDGTQACGAVHRRRPRVFLRGGRTVGVR
jgi:nickel-dependent lactate racemase